MFLDRRTTGTNRRKGKWTPTCRLCKTNMPLPNPSALLYNASVLCATLLHRALWHKARDPRRAWGFETRSQHHSKGAGVQKNQKGMKFVFNPPHTYLHVYASVQPRWFFSVSCIKGHSSTIALAPSCYTVTAFLPWSRKKIPTLWRKGKNVLPLCYFHHFKASFNLSTYTAGMT